MTQSVNRKQEQLMLSEFHKLSPDKQQEVIDFIEFLRNKSLQQEAQSNQYQPLSAYEAAKQWAGCVDSGTR